MIGQIVFTVGTFAMLNWLPADGRCLPTGNYPELSRLLRVGDDWPYGRCLYNQGFKLPNTCDQNRKCAMIKVN